MFESMLRIPELNAEPCRALVDGDFLGFCTAEATACCRCRSTTSTTGRCADTNADGSSTSDNSESWLSKMGVLPL
jgi:hypothetical protein